MLTTLYRKVSFRIVRTSPSFRTTRPLGGTWTTPERLPMPLMLRLAAAFRGLLLLPATAPPLPKLLVLQLPRLLPLLLVSFSMPVVGRGLDRRCTLTETCLASLPSSFLASAQRCKMMLLFDDDDDDDDEVVEPPTICKSFRETDRRRSPPIRSASAQQSSIPSMACCRAKRRCCSEKEQKSRDDQVSSSGLVALMAFSMDGGVRPRNILG